MSTTEVKEEVGRSADGTTTHLMTSSVEGDKDSQLVDPGPIKILGKEPDEIEQNMKLWNSVATTDERFIQPVKLGSRHFTAIDATYQKRRATAVWGPYGRDWRLKNLKWGQIVGSTGACEEITLEAIFEYPGGEFEVADEIPWKRGDDCRKKLQTSTLKKALSYLGFSADVHMGRFDEEKYRRRGDDDRRGFSYAASDGGKKKCDEILEYMKKCDDIARLEKAMDAARHRGLTPYFLEKVERFYKQRREFLENAGAFG